MKNCIILSLENLSISDEDISKLKIDKFDLYIGVIYGIKNSKNQCIDWVCNKKDKNIFYFICNEKELKNIYSFFYCIKNYISEYTYEYIIKLDEKDLTFCNNIDKMISLMNYRKDIGMISTRVKTLKNNKINHSSVDKYLSLLNLNNITQEKEEFNLEDYKFYNFIEEEKDRKILEHYIKIGKKEKLQTSFKIGGYPKGSFLCRTKDLVDIFTEDKIDKILNEIKKEEIISDNYHTIKRIFGYVFKNKHILNLRKALSLYQDESEKDISK